MGAMIFRIAAAVLIFVFILVFIFAAFTWDTSFAANQKGTVVNCNYRVNVRSGPGTGYKIIGKAPKGAVYDVTGRSGNWYRIDFGGRKGYIYSKYLSVTDEKPEPQMGKVVNCNYRVNVRSGPGTRHSIIGKAPKGAQYVVTGKSGSWYSIVYNGRTGYIYKKYLSVYTLPKKDTIVEGYYGSWAAYSGYTPLDIPADKLDIVSYAFARVGEDLSVTMGDPHIDTENFKDLRSLKERYPGLRTVISIGGWSGSGRFSDAALTAQSRAAFADSAVLFMKQHGFDGIDIDWEYPVSGGLSSNKRRPQDKTNFTLLMAQLRARLDAQAATDGLSYLLTFAGASEKFYTDNVELNKLAAYVDYALVMTYDIHGDWSGYTDFNSPLYTPSANSPQKKWSCEDAVKLWESCGFPRSKMIMGVPFYGYVYGGAAGANNGLYQRFSSGGAESYDEIADLYLGGPPYNRFVHSEARVPWLFGNGVFVSYDDEYSAAQKGTYIIQNGLAGAGIWELSQNEDGKLLRALYESMQGG